MNPRSRNRSHTPLQRKILWIIQLYITWKVNSCKSTRAHQFLQINSCKSTLAHQLLLVNACTSMLTLAGACSQSITSIVYNMLDYISIVDLISIFKKSDLILQRELDSWQKTSFWTVQTPFLQLLLSWQMQIPPFERQFEADRSALAGAAVHVWFISERYEETVRRERATSSELAVRSLRHYQTYLEIRWMRCTFWRSAYMLFACMALCFASFAKRLFTAIFFAFFNAFQVAFSAATFFLIFFCRALLSFTCFWPLGLWL